LSLFRRGLLIIPSFAVLLVAGTARGEDLDARKTGPQLFESTCSACHRSPHGLAKNQSPSSLVGFLRQHYTTGPGPAGQLAAYLMANPGDGRAAKPVVPTAAKPESPPERQPAARQAGPAAEPPTTRGRPSRAARKPAEGPGIEPAAPTSRDARAADPKPPVAAEAVVPAVPASATPAVPATPAVLATPVEASTTSQPTVAGDQSAFSAPTP
jgi:hypothetical protein